MIVNQNEWTVVASPGFAGKRKAERDAERDRQYGPGNWTIGFLWGDLIVERALALQFYEDAYVEFFRSRPDRLEWLVSRGSDVYDNARTNVESGLDYRIQESSATHLQDIALRRAVVRLGQVFRGDHLVEVRGHESEGYQLNPGQVPFHLPQMIHPAPTLCPEWANQDSIEAFWQCNKRFLVRKSCLRSVCRVYAILQNSEDGKIVLVERAAPLKGWSLPGGDLHFGEQTEASVKKHVLEQTGYLADVENLFMVSSAPQSSSEQHVVSIIFLAQITGEIENVQAGPVIRRARRFSPIGCPETMVENHREILEPWFGERSSH